MKSVRKVTKVLRSERLRRKQRIIEKVQISAKKPTRRPLKRKKNGLTTKRRKIVTAVSGETTRKPKEETLHDVDEVLRVRYVPSANRCEYEILWKPPRNKPNARETTWEPLENIMGCPFLLLRNEHERHVKWKLEAPQGTVVADGQKEPLHPENRPPKFIEHELQMDGSEWVVKIYSEIKYPVDDLEGFGPGDSISYFLVRMADGRIDYVQRSYLEYYNPTILALFLTDSG